jgi:hypothetical protein
MRVRRDTMDSNNFDDLFAQAGIVIRALRETYKEVAGEELDLESGLKNYPLLVIGLAAGAGVLGGWWIARRTAPPALPPPQSQTQAEGTAPLDYLERLFPNGVNKVKDALPEGVADEAAAAARKWVEGVLEPKLKQSVDNAAESRFGSFLRETVRRFEQGEDRTLDDPEK